MEQVAFTKKSTADEVASVYASRASGKLFLITGGYGGLGEETALSLLRQNARVYILGRSQSSLDGFLDRNRAEFGDRVAGGLCDMADLKSVREAANEFLAKHKTLDVLINNAGVMNTPQGETAQGIETQFGVNVVASYFLTKLLLPALKASSDGGRIVFLSSVGHSIHGAARLNLEYYKNYDAKSSKYNGWVQYQQSKLGDLLLAKGFYDKVPSAAVHPGFIQSTGLTQHSSIWSQVVFMFHNWRKVDAMKSIPEGASTTVYAALVPELEKGGGYYVDCAVREPHENASHREDVLALMEYCEQLTAKF